MLRVHLAFNSMLTVVVGGPTAAVAKLFRDKTVMKQVLREQKVSCPRFSTIDRERVSLTSSDKDVEIYYNELISKLDSLPPYIVKPVDGFLAVGVTKIFSFADFLKWRNS